MEQSSLLDEFNKYRPLLTDVGREEMARALSAFRERYGAEWLEEFKQKNPGYALIVDLAANFDFPEALEGLKKHIAGIIGQEPNFFKQQALQTTANVFIHGAAGELQNLHGFLKAEIDRPRL